MPYEADLEIHRIHPNPRNKNIHTEESVDQLAANIKAYMLSLLNNAIHKAKRGNL